MTILDVQLADESEKRYLTYALSVVSSRALPDVRDGLKPVQRRILYAMVHQLNLTPDKYHRKSAAVVGEVLARFHPHGDSACYEAMVRMAQDFSLRYPLVDGQGNFGSLDGDSAAAYRYTEARLTPFAMEVIGDIGEETVTERDNFDQTLKEPVVLPSRAPNLLINGASGIAVGMATAIPPHNLREVIKALLMLIEDEETTDRKLLSAIKGPDFPTGCQILSTAAELRDVYREGRGAIRMRSAWKMEKGSRGKEFIVITSIPYSVEKSSLVEKIADLIIARKVPQVVDVRDESTDEVRVVLELASGSAAQAEKAMAYFFKHTPLQTNFNVNLTALVPTENPLSPRPALLSLREILLHFVQFRIEVTRSKLLFEKSKLDERIHLLEGLMKIFDDLNEVIKIVRKSEGRSDAAAKLQKRFTLTEKQALFIVDLRIYQLSKTSIDEIEAELKLKLARVAEIKRILGSEKAIKAVVATDLKRIDEVYGDARRSEIIADFEEVEVREEEFIEHETVFAVVTADGWMKRISAASDPKNTRIREGDRLFFVAKADTRSTLVLFSNFGNSYGSSVYDLTATTGFGDPVQKLFRFEDGEQIVACLIIPHQPVSDFPKEVLLYTERGYGFRFPVDQLAATKKIGKRVARLSEGDKLRGMCIPRSQFVLALSQEGYGIFYPVTEIPVLTGPGKGVILQKIPADDSLMLIEPVEKKSKIRVEVQQGGVREILIGDLEMASRAKRGLKLIKRGGPVVGLAAAEEQLFSAAEQLTLH